MAQVTLEICVDSPEGLAAAIEGGADRIELCTALNLGGLTPSPGLIEKARHAGIPVVAMVRPRAGDFVYGPDDLEVMEADITAIRRAGLSGVVFGASLPDGRLDEGTLARLIAATDGLELTLHRCFDLVPDRAEAMEVAVRLGFARILTSGGATTATAGFCDISDMIALARGRIAIMPGSGITPANAGSLLDRLPITDIHASCGARLGVAPRTVTLGFATGTEKQTEASRVRALKQVVTRNGAPKLRSL